MSVEEFRRNHEEKERIMECFIKELQFEPRNHKEKVNSEHRQYFLLTRNQDITKRLIDGYDDKLGIRKKEIASMSTPHEYTEFYSQLAHIKEYHKRNSEETITSLLSLEYDKFEKIRENPEEAGAPVVEFSDEEGYGKFLDLHECFQAFINLKVHSGIDYVTYLTRFDKLDEFPKDKKNYAYHNYLLKVTEYLQGFLARARPMLEYTNVEARKQAEEKFAKEWEEGKFKGWVQEQGSAMAAQSCAHLDLSSFNSAKELESVGLDRLKSALVALGLKCGGTLEERAQRLWLTKGRSTEELETLKELRPRVAAGRRAVGSAEGSRRTAWLEAKINYMMANLLDEERMATIENVQRKQARSLAELEEEEESDEDVDAVTDSGVDYEENTTIYNPKNLPLDWDGKPIPYWLYKLHGLNMYYTCEICGNETYRGPKAFQQHFTEWRHAHGMRCLGIPNMPAFSNITNIADAVALWSKINAGRAQLQHKQEEEEYEDGQGNVISRRTFDDLKRQGLL